MRKAALNFFASLMLLVWTSVSFGANSCPTLFIDDVALAETPAWVQSHVSPKPLSAALIKAIETIPSFKGRKTRILLPIAAGASPEGLDALISKAKHMDEGVELHMWVNGVPRPIMEKIRDAAGKVEIFAHFLGPNMRDLYRDGFIQLVPGYLAQFPTRVLEGHPDYQFDAILTRVSEPDSSGRVNLGANCDLVCTVISAQPKVMIIGEVNPHVPHTYRNSKSKTRENSIAKNRVTALFRSDSKLAHPEAAPLTPVESAIGLNLAKLISDGATLQVGIGNIFGGLPHGLRQLKRTKLKIWTEMMGDVLQEVMQDGIATEAVIGFGFGSQSFYNWLNRNPLVKLEATSIVNDPRLISRKKLFHAVNTALQVSLTGEVNATTGPLSRGRISSPGGQVEFLTGASWSDGGKSIIAIRSTATMSNPDGTKNLVSTIVPRTYPVRDGTPGAFVSHIVTEYGIAELAGKSERDKTIALIRIAHPDFREKLFREAIDPSNPHRVSGMKESDLQLVNRNSEVQP